MAHGKHKKKKTLSSPLSESRPVREPNRPSFQENSLSTLKSLVAIMAEGPTRDAKVITNRVKVRSDLKDLVEVEDRRRAQDVSRTQGARRYLTVAAVPADTVYRDVRTSRMRRLGMPPYARLEFRDDARRIIVCLRRHRRREVLFSLGRIGRGLGRGRKRLKRARWTDASYITCKKRR